MSDKSGELQGAAALVLISSAAASGQQQTSQPVGSSKSGVSPEVAKIESLKKASKNDEALRLAIEFLNKTPEGESSGKVTVIRAELLFSLKRDEEAMRILEWFVAHSAPNKAVGDAFELMAVYHERRSAPSTAEAIRQKLRGLLPDHPAAIKFYRGKVREAFERQDYAGVVK